MWNEPSEKYLKTMSRLYETENAPCRLNYPGDFEEIRKLKKQPIASRKLNLRVNHTRAVAHIISPREGAEMKEWLIITTSEADLNAGYLAVDETVDVEADNLEPLRTMLEKIEREKGVPGYRLDITYCWIDDEGKEQTDLYGTAEEYLLQHWSRL